MQAPNYHNPCVLPVASSWQTVNMVEQEKNGGQNHLRAWRIFRGLTQAEIAEAVGTNANMIQYLETGERGLSAKWLRRLAPTLNTSPGMLLDHDPSDLDSDILEIWANADSRARQQLGEIARTLTKTGTDD